MKYEEILNNLSSSLKGKSNQENSKVFLNSIKSLKEDFKQKISTKFLRDLMGSFSSRQKTKRINYLLKKSGLKTKKESRFGFREWGLNKYLIDIVTYARDKQNQVFIKDIRKENIGNLTYLNKVEVLHFINI
jgi:hypothetical protein